MEKDTTNSNYVSGFQSTRKRESCSKDDVNLSFKKQVLLLDSNFENSFDKEFLSIKCPSTTLGTDLIHIPNEIFTYIFEFLPLRDRKNVKLVCQRWNSVCNVQSLLRKEKIIFHGLFYNENELVKLVKDHTSEVLNLEICRATLTDVKSLWELHGYKITFLKLVKCDVSDEILELIITHCDNLEELHWKGSLFRYTNILKLLLSKNIVKKKLASFFMHVIDTQHITDYTFYALFNIFPNIKKFVFKCNKWNPYHDISIGQQQNYSETELTCSGAMQKIVDSSNLMETFGFKLFEPIWKIISSVNFIRLKHVDVFIPNDVSNELIFTFFKRHSLLESIVCSSFKMENFPEEFLLLLLKNCPNLRNLRLRFLASTGFVIDENLYDKLAASNLQTLIIFSGNIHLRDTFSSHSLKINNTLKTLRLPLVSVEEVQLLFIRTFRNLTFLEFPCVSQAVNAEIGELQNNLENLNLIGLCRRVLPPLLQTCTAGVRDKSMKNAIDSSYSWMPDSFSLFSSLTSIVSRLNTLRIVVRQWNNANDTMEKFLRNATNLEILCIDWKHSFCGHCSDCNYVYESWLDACSNLPNLRCLQIINTWKSYFFTEQTYRMMFHRCSSLRFLSHKNGFSSNFYYFDVMKKKVTSDCTISCCLETYLGKVY